MELMKIMRKRWALATALLVLTLIATAVAFVKLPWTYQSTGDVVFLPSKNLAKAYGGNPYLAFTSAINETADLIRYETTDMGTARALATAGYAQPYTVKDPVDTSAPVLLITVTGSNAGAVGHTLTGVANEITTLLASQQSSIKPVDQIHDIVIASSPQATRMTSKKARPLLVVLVVGLLFTVTIPALVDAVSERGRARRDSGLVAEPFHPDAAAAGTLGARQDKNSSLSGKRR